MTSPRRPILITGAAGFIGSHLARAVLDRGDMVVGVDNFDPFYDRAMKERALAALACDRFTFIEADVCDAPLLSRVFEAHRPGVVHHLAALAGVRPSIEAPSRYARVNLDGLVNVLEACRATGVERVVFASSSSVYGNNRKVPFAETDPVDEPISPYAATKRAGELICHTYASLFNLAIACVRLFTVYGPRQRPDLAISKFMGLIARGEAVPVFGDGSSSRDYTYIDDIIAGVLAAEARIGSPEVGRYRTWNLGGSSPITLADMVEAIARTVGRPARLDRRPMQPGDVERTWADLSRAEAELSFRPRTPFNQGLERQWEWMKKQA